MYGKAFCVLIIVLIFIYNLATGSVETVASSNNEYLTSWATYGTLVQAGAAILALFISVYTFWQQKEMTRRQINLSLYEKRYRIYRECISFIRDIYNYNKFPEYKNIELYQGTVKIATDEDAQELYNKIFPDALFLLMNEDVEQLKETVQKKMEVLALVDELEYSLRGVLPKGNEYNKKCHEISREIGTFARDYEMLINERFKKYLDFKNI